MWTNTSPIVAYQIFKINKKRTNFSPKGVLVLKVEKIIDKENVIGSNIRRIRVEKGMGQTELVRELQLHKIAITRETLVKIEGGRQHIKLDQLRAIRDILQVSYEDLLQ